MLMKMRYEIRKNHQNIQVDLSRHKREVAEDLATSRSPEVIEGSHAGR